MIDPKAWVGKKIGHYVIQTHIQRGGMADVFLAADEWLERPSAIKVLFPTLSSDPDFVRRFQREAKTVARLRHQHIVQIYTTGVTDDGHYYIAMEYVPGGSLQDKLSKLAEEGTLFETITAIGIIHQVAEALSVAHKVGVVHRDIKPSNILLREDGTPVLTDLGIAQVQDKPGLTRTHALVGTPTYMSPEQATTSQVDGRSDIYSLGAIFYELFSGKKMFDGDTPWAVLHKHITEKPRPITEIRRDITPATWHVLQKCLEKEPADRYQTADDLLQALDEALVAENAADQVGLAGTWVGTQPGDTATLLARETVIAKTPLMLTKTAVVQPEPSPQPNLEKKRPSWLIPAAVVLLLVLCGGGALAAGALRGMILPPATPTAGLTAMASSTPTHTAVTLAPTETPFNAALASIEALAVILSATPDPSATPAVTNTVPPTTTPVSAQSPTAVTTPTTGVTPLATARPSATPRATATSGGSNPSGGTSSGGGLPLTFEAFGTWVRGNEANGSFTSSTAQAHGGAASGKLSYDFGTADNDYVVFLQNNAISGSPNALQLWVHGDGAGHFLNAWILDAGGQTWQVPFGRVTHTGWKQMTGYIDTDQSWPWTIISGGSDANVDYPISFRGFVLDDLNNAYTGQGTIYLDDLTSATLTGTEPTPSAATPTPGGSPTSGATAPPPDPNTVGRILYSSGNILLTTDPAWSSPVELGTIASDTCSSPASTVSGQTYSLYFGPYCGITANGTSVCQSPNGQYEVLTNKVDNGVYSIVVRLAGAADHTFIYQGQVDLAEGIRWSPVSSNFLFIVGDTVHQAFLNGSYNQIIPTAFEPRFSPDGSQILYRKPIAAGITDVFVANSDGANQHNVTNVTAVDKRCAVWKN